MKSLESVQAMYVVTVYLVPVYKAISANSFILAYIFRDGQFDPNLVG